MIHKIKVKKNSYPGEILLFNEINLSSLPTPKIVPLFGANGSGKTTLIKSLENKGDYKNSLTIEKDDGKHIILLYRNSSNNFRVRKLGAHCTPEELAARFNAQSISEGQSIMYSLNILLYELKYNETSVFKSSNQYIVLLDEFDSGLSIDNIDNVLNSLKYIGENNENIQVFFSFNNPYVLKYFPYVVSMYDGKVHCIKDQAEMFDEIMKHKAMLAKLRGDDGEYKIYN